LNIKVENFRPNLLVMGGTGMPHQEDRWKRITVLEPLTSANFNSSDKEGSSKEAHLPSPSPSPPIRIDISGPCSRCSMVNVDGSSGTMTCKAFQALATYRKDGSSVYFGQFGSLNEDYIGHVTNGADNYGGKDDSAWLCTGSIVMAEE
jgi:hypothetical protein